MGGVDRSLTGGGHIDQESMRHLGAQYRNDEVNAHGGHEGQWGYSKARDVGSPTP